LDFVNTRFGVGEHRRDWLDSDARVLEWLRRAGLPTLKFKAEAQRGALLEVALALRESVRGLLEKRQQGSVGNAAVLNRVLALDSSYSKLAWSKELPAWEQHRRVTCIEGLLVPVAQAAAALIARADFSLVRECESSDCTFWFSDRTKSHRRRWCSAALCGNRMKVAAFRARKNGLSAKGRNS
jgi:predicted RNA-binding Zn ribbon-like protein